MSRPTPPADPARPNPWLIPVTLFFGSLLLLWGVVLATRSHYTTAMLDLDELEYYDLAGELLQGRYDFNPRRVIGYFLLIASIRKVFGDSILAIQLVVSFFAAFTAPLLYLLVRREFGHARVALLAGLAAMAWPMYVRYGATLYSETVAVPMFAATLLCFPRPRTGRPGSGLGRWFAAGMMLGLCMHFRPMFLIYAPFGALQAYWRGRPGREGLNRFAMLTAGCLLVVLPWTAVLSSHEHQFVLLSSNGGETLGGGFNPELIRREREGQTEVVTPGGRVTSVIPGKWVTLHETGYLSPEELKLPYTKQSDLVGKRARAWMLANPGLALYIAVRKLTYMWGIYPFWTGLGQTLAGNLPLVVLLILTGVAVVRFRRHYRETSMFWCLPIFVSLVALIGWGSWRFREPGDLGLFALAAALPWARQVEQFFRDNPLQGLPEPYVAPDASET